MDDQPAPEVEPGAEKKHLRQPDSGLSILMVAGI
jgi:hypothetical protein